MGKIYAHRNLNKTKTLGWGVHIYSYGQVSGNIGRGKVDGYTEDRETLVLNDVAANCNKKALQAIADGAYRSVTAWLIGTKTDTKIDDNVKLRKFSIDPKRGELSFRWSDNRDEEVQFPLPTVHLRHDGCYAVIS